MSAPAADAVNTYHAMGASSKTKGVLKFELCYFAKLQFQTLSICSPLTPCLAQAIEWHSTMVASRGAVARRLDRGGSFEDSVRAVCCREPWWYKFDKKAGGLRCQTVPMRDFR